jgi:uncharacterized protein YdeI (YjbR/CyaY-like superfamily)
MKNIQYDNYIEKSQEFAQPILSHLRELIHKACPSVEEKIKWGFPNFEYKKTILCSMASFKNHCAFGFWLGSLMVDPEHILNQKSESAMGQLGRITSLKDLPSDEVLIQYIFQAMDLIDKGVKLNKKETTEKKELEVPAILQQALSENDKAKATFDNFSNSNKKEYINWINDAKTEVTMKRRLEDAIEWMSEGKVRNWKYLKC